MYHLMTCGDAPNCTWAVLTIPTLAGVNCAQRCAKVYLTIAIKDSTKKTKSHRAYNLAVTTIMTMFVEVALGKGCFGGSGGGGHPNNINHTNNTNNNHNYN